MDKTAFVDKVARRHDLKPEAAESIVDSALAELIAPAVFVKPGERRMFADNNCNNNCSAEMARVAPSRPT